MERTEMNSYYSHEYARHHQAELLREADRTRLAKVARGAKREHRMPMTSGRAKVVLALGAAAVGILATASVALGAF